MSKVELTNMCMIYDPQADKVLVQDRIKSWKGITFPGGHVEKGESIIDSTIREVKEETGLTVANLELCGIVHWYNDTTDETYMVFSYRTTVYSGELLEETAEGRNFWVDRDKLSALSFASGFEERLPMFFGDKVAEGFSVWNEHRKGELVWK